MSKIDQALETLALALKDLEPKPPVINYRDIVNSIPFRALSGDHIEGGIIRNFASSGITDTAMIEQIKIADSGVTVTSLSVATVASDVTFAKSVTVNGTIKAQRLEVNELQADIRIERSSSLEFKEGKNDPVYGKGLLWMGNGTTKQFVYNTDPDKFFSSETIDLANGKGFSINGINVLNATSIGSGVEKSNLRELGQLRSLAVGGDVNINNNIYYAASSRRLGIGTDTPNAAISIADNNIELVLGGTLASTGAIGTFTNSDLELVTDNVARITISSSGNITLGNKTRAPAQVNIHGKLAIGVNTPDPSVDLHVSGAIKFSNNIHSTGESAPSYGSFTQGDIVWNTKPAPGGWIGWVCIASGSPGTWIQFGAVAR
jgi:hypothetical protein